MARARVGNAGAAAIVGVAPSTWRAYVNRGQAPAPDGHEEISGAPWWYEATVRRWADNRPGRGARTDLA